MEEICVADPLSLLDAQLGARLIAIALERGGEYADIYFEHTTSAEYVLEEEKVRRVSRAVVLGLGVRVLRGDATGYAYTEDLAFERMARAARTAASIASAGGAPRPVPLARLGVPDFYPVRTPLLEASPEGKLALLRRVDQAARRHDPRIDHVEVTLSEAMKHVVVVTSDGHFVRDLQPIVQVRARAIAAKGDQRKAGVSAGGGRVGLEYFETGRGTPEHHGQEAARRAVAMLDAREAPAGEMTVVVAPAHAGVLIHEAIGHGLEADFNRKRLSNYSGRVGQRVASLLCTIVDDGTVPSSRGSINIDDEGNPGQENVLIEDGVLVGYMHDRISARHFGRTPSGNGRRQSFREAPLPRMTNTVLRPGPHSPEEIVRSVRRGVFVSRISGGEVNISTGDFVFSPDEAYLIEDGRMTAPLCGVNLIGNGPDVLTRVSMVGDDFQLADGSGTCGKNGQFVPVGMGTPTVKIDRITVGGTRT